MDIIGPNFSTSNLHFVLEANQPNWENCKCVIQNKTPGTSVFALYTMKNPIRPTKHDADIWYAPPTSKSLAHLTTSSAITQMSMAQPRSLDMPVTRRLPESYE